MTIPTKTLGRTGVEVSILGYGAMELRGPDTNGGPAISDEDAGRLLNGLLDAGVNLIDTSIDYGRSEELIGRYLSSRRNAEIAPRGPFPTELYDEAKRRLGAGNV
jgi:aryl-alcohol dehydrogenase-like predicted oxidoreductase